MKKILSVYDRVAEWLCSFDSDKPFDAKDWLFTVIGGVIGALMFLI